MNKREIGIKLEETVVEKIKKIEPNCRRTKNSGANTELEDVLSSLFLVQCKVDNKSENIIIQKKDWQQLFRKLPIGSTRVPIFVNEQKDGIISVTLTIGDFFELIHKCYEATGGL